MPINQNVLTILAECTVDGNALALPPVQLDRPVYEAVNKILTAMGGKWNRKAKAHLFDDSPADLLDTVVMTGNITDKKKDLQQFFTPPSTADLVIRRAAIGPNDRVLEPSVGRGALLHALHRSDRNGALDADGEIVCVEKDPLCMNHIAGHFPYVHRVTANFLDLSSREGHHVIGNFDRVIMNPPFSAQQDVDHVRHAFGFLRAGGVLVSIMSPSWYFRTNRKSLEFRSWIADMGADIEDLPPDSFKESGTGVSTKLVTIRRPICQ